MVEAEPGEGRPQEGSGNGVIWLSEVEPEEIEWLWFPYVPLRKVTLLIGDPEAGKTTIDLAIATAISTGGPLPGQEKTSQGSVLFMSGEDGLADTLVPRLDKLGADRNRICAPKEVFTLNPKGLKRLGKLITQVHPLLIVIDPLSLYLGEDRDMYRANQVRPMMNALAQIAQDNDCAIVMNAHLSKADQRSAMLRVSGTVDFAAAARSVLFAAQVDPNKQHGVLAHAKCNIARRGPSWEYWLKEEEGLMWGNIVDITADELATRKPGKGGRKKKTKLQVACEFLLRRVAHEPVRSTVLDAEIKDLGISEQTLRNARLELIREGRVDSIFREGHWYVELITEPAE